MKRGIFVQKNINKSFSNGQEMRTPSACSAMSFRRNKLVFSPANKDRPAIVTTNERAARSCSVISGGILNNPIVSENQKRRKCSPGGSNI